VRQKSAWPMRLLALVLSLPAGEAEARRVYYQVDGRTYWYELSEQAARDREAAQAAARVIQERVVRERGGPDGAAQAGPAAEPTQVPEPEPDEVTGALPRAAAPSIRRPTASGTRAPPARAKPAAVRAAKPAAPKSAARKPAAQPKRPERPAAVAIEPGRSTAAESLEPPPRPETGPVADANVQAAMPPSNQAAAAPDTTGSVEAPITWPDLPVPPAPGVIESVTYDYINGLKRTVLRDGTTYQDTFDPKAFYRLGAAAPLGAGGPRSDAAPPSEAPPEQR
jgi:hypothetical protein